MLRLVGGGGQRNMAALLSLHSNAFGISLQDPHMQDTVTNQLPKERQIMGFLHVE